MMFQMTKKWLAAWMSVLLMMSGVLVAPPTGPVEAQAAPPTVSIGQYIQFGKYNDAPILWRVIHKDPTTGDPILFSDRILTLKAFDAKGSYHTDTTRLSNGSSYYPDSNIRQWLNSNSANSGANTIDWIQNDPSAANMWNGYNPYNTEKGFLADGNFTSTERSLIKPYTHKVLLVGVDQAKKDGGTANHTWNANIANVVQNYDTTAYFQNVTDSIFMLSVKQLKEWVYDNRLILGTSYHIAKPTAEAVTQSTYKTSSLNSGSNWHYWSNSPDASGSSYPRHVVSTGIVSSETAYGSVTIGVRPALQLNLASAIFTSGTGTSGDSFVASAAPTNQAPTNISLSASSIAENSASGTTVGTLSATDADAGDTATFTLVSGAGDTDNASFTIDGPALKTAASFDYETKSSYSIRVRVTDSGAATYEKAFTVSVTNVEDAVPSTPTGLAATKITHNSISLSWGAASDDIAVVGYNVFRNGLYVASTTGTKYTITGLNPLSSHNITVQAYDAIRNKSARSTALAVSTIAPPDLIPPTAPTSLTAVGVTKNHIMFQWSGATDNVGVTRYNIYLNGTYSKTTTVTKSEFLNLTSSTAYNVRIQAVDAAGNRSPLSSVLTMTTLDGIAPTVPDGLAASVVTKTGFRVTWNAATDNGAVTKYNVYNNGVYVQTVTGTSYTFSGLAVNLTHQITVLAIDDAGNRSAQSTALSVATTFVSDPIAPSAPSDLAGSNITKTSARVTWTAATDNVAVTNYNIYRNGAYVATVSGTTTAYNVAGLTAGTSYNITVRALDAAKNFTNSTALSVTTLP